MTESKPPSSTSQEFSETLLDQIFRLWVEPAIAERELGMTRADITKAIVLLPPSEPPKVLINDDFEVSARVRLARPVEAGQTVTLEDVAGFENFEPAELDPNAGWIGFARIANEIVVAFDFRRNRQTARLLINRAQEFLEAATDSLRRGHLGPAIENCFAAAELAVKAEMFLMIDSPTTNHRQRVAWWEQWVKLGNAPAALAPSLERLYNERGASRYGDSPITMSDNEVRLAVQDVAAIIEHARGRSADRSI